MRTLNQKINNIAVSATDEESDIAELIRHTKKTAISVLANVAEGTVVRKEFHHQIALGSLIELQSHLCILSDLAVLTVEELSGYTENITEICKEICVIVGTSDLDEFIKLRSIRESTHYTK